MRAERRLVLVIAVIAVVVVVLDQLTKLVVLDRLAPGAPVTVVPGLVALTLVMNPGLAFGLLAGVPPGWRWIVVPLSLLALLVLLRVALRILPTGGWRERSAIGLVFGGAVGNLIDRARGEKCERCWMRSERVGENAAHPTLCERCVPVVLARSRAS